MYMQSPTRSFESCIRNNNASERCIQRRIYRNFADLAKNNLYNMCKKFLKFSFDELNS